MWNIALYNETYRSVHRINVRAYKKIHLNVSCIGSGSILTCSFELRLNWRQSDVGGTRATYALQHLLVNSVKQFHCFFNGHQGRFWTIRSNIRLNRETSWFLLLQTSSNIFRVTWRKPYSFGIWPQPPQWKSLFRANKDFISSPLHEHQDFIPSSSLCVQALDGICSRWIYCSFSNKSSLTTYPIIQLFCLLPPGSSRISLHGHINGFTDASGTNWRVLLMYIVKWFASLERLSTQQFSAKIQLFDHLTILLTSHTIKL